MIAYTAAQVNTLLFFKAVSNSYFKQTYLSLSSAKKWNTFIDNFNLDDFYENMVEIFEQNANTLFIKETLEWWNM